MAAIDKIYGNLQQYNDLKEFLTKNKPEYLDYLGNPPPKKSGGSIANFSDEAEEWLLENCELDFVVEAILEHLGEDDC